MATFNNGESGLSVRTKINNVLQHADGTASELVINEAGADVNFRVESDTNANALFVDGGTGNVGIGTTAPSRRLDVRADAANSVQARFGFVSGRGLEISTALAGGTNDAGSVFNALGSAAGTLIFQTDSAERMRIDSTGNVGIGTSAPQMPLTVNGVVQAINSTGVTLANGATGTVLTPPRGYSYVNISTVAGTTYGLLLLVFRQTLATTIISTVNDRTSGLYSASVSGTALQVTNASGISSTYFASCVNIGYGTGN